MSESTSTINLDGLLKTYRYWQDANQETRERHVGIWAECQVFCSWIPGEFPQAVKVVASREIESDKITVSWKDSEGCEHPIGLSTIERFLEFTTLEFPTTEDYYREYLKIILEFSARATN